MAHPSTTGLVDDGSWGLANSPCDALGVVVLGARSTRPARRLDDPAPIDDRGRRGVVQGEVAARTRCDVARYCASRRGLVRHAIDHTRPLGRDHRFADGPADAVPWFRCSRRPSRVVQRIHSRWARFGCCVRSLRGYERTRVSGIRGIPISTTPGCLPAPWLPHVTSSALVERAADLRGAGGSPRPKPPAGGESARGLCPRGPPTAVSTVSTGRPCRRQTRRCFRIRSPVRREPQHTVPPRDAGAPSSPPRHPVRPPTEQTWGPPDRPWCARQGTLETGPRALRLRIVEMTKRGSALSRSSRRSRSRPIPCVHLRVQTPQCSRASRAGARLPPSRAAETWAP